MRSERSTSELQPYFSHIICQVITRLTSFNNFADLLLGTWSLSGIGNSGHFECSGTQRCICSIQSYKWNEASIAQGQSTGLVNQGSWVQFSLEARGNDCFYFSWFESNERENWDTFKWENPTWRLAFRLCNKVDCSSHLWTVSPLASSTAFCSLIAACSLQVVDGLKSQCLQYLKM